MKKLAGLFATAIIFAIPVHASAHVAVRSEDGKSAVILHLTPDDNPMAGELSNIYIGLRASAFSEATHFFSLRVIDSGVERNLPVYIQGETLASFYVFPKQGVYDIRLNIQPKDTNAHATTFSYQQRVMRGVSASPLDQKSYPAADASIVVGFVLLFLLGVFGFRLRKEILRYSKQNQT